MGVTRQLRNLWRTWKGRRIENPALAAPVHSILFVCLGNICRSPFAEVIASQRFRVNGAGPLRVCSAGIRTRQAAEPPPEAKATAARYGVSLDAHRPRLLTAELMAAYDMIVVMESSQGDLLRRQYPKQADRVFLLSLFDATASGLERYAIEDPFGCPPSAYETCYERIDRTVTNLLSALHAAKVAGNAVKRPE